MKRRYYSKWVSQRQRLQEIQLLQHNGVQARRFTAMRAMRLSRAKENRILLDNPDIFKFIFEFLPLVGKVMFASTCSSFRGQLYHLHKSEDVLGMMYNAESECKEILPRILSINLIRLWDMKYCTTSIKHTELIKELLQRCCNNIDDASSQEIWVECLCCLTSMCRISPTQAPIICLLCEECNDFPVSFNEITRYLSTYFMFYNLDSQDLRIRMRLLKCFLASLFPIKSVRSCYERHDGDEMNLRLQWKSFLRPVLAPDASCLDDLLKKTERCRCLQNMFFDCYPGDRVARECLNESLRIDLILLLILICYNIVKKRIFHNILCQCTDGNLLDVLTNLVKTPRFISRIYHTERPELETGIHRINLQNIQNCLKTISIQQIFKYISRKFVEHKRT